MKRTTLSFSAIAALTLTAGFAHAGPTGKHETCSAHFPSENIWTSSSSWTGSPPASQIADNAVLTTGWTLDNPPDIAQNMMFDYVSMDGGMNMISHFTHSDISLYSIEVTRSAGGTPDMLDFTINSEVYEGVGGFLIELAAPVTVSMQRTGYIAAGLPGLFYAQYEGVLAEKTMSIIDPGVDGLSRLFRTEGGIPMEFEILTSVPTPGTLGIAGLGLMLGSKRRRASQT